MRKETDLARVKMIAHVLLDMPIAETSFSPAIAGELLELRTVQGIQWKVDE